MQPHLETPKNERSIVKKAPSVLALPEIPLGKDDVSFQPHNRIIQAQWSKLNKNVMVVEELMERTSSHEEARHSRELL